MLLLALVMTRYFDSSKLRSGNTCYGVYEFYFNITPGCYNRKYCLNMVFPNNGEYCDYRCEDVAKVETYNPYLLIMNQIETCQGTQYIVCCRGRRIVPNRTPLPTCTPKPLPTKTLRPIKSLVCITPQPYKAKPVPAAIALYQFLFE